MSTKVKVGSKAYIFHDQSTGITIKKGEIVELSTAQMNSKRVRSAINGGHLVITTEEIEKENNQQQKDETTVSELSKKFYQMYKSGMTVDKLTKAFNLDTLKALANAADIEVTDDDTKLSIVQALIEDIDSNQD